MTTVEETQVESVRIEPTATSTSPPATAVASEVPSTLRWGAIVGGTVAALGIGALLYSLGLALGLSAIDPQDPGSLKPSSIFTGVWALVVPLVALFVGGFVAARGAHALNRVAGSLHGLVMWGLTVVAGMWLIGNVVSGLASGAAAVGRTAAGVVREASPAIPQLTQQLGLGMEDALGPINARLQAQGKPQVTPEQLQAATGDVVQTGMRQGRIDRQALLNAISTNTALERNEAEELATRIETQFAASLSRMKQQLADVRESALSAAEDTGTVFWGVFGALLLGMFAAIGGALLGSTKDGRTRPQSIIHEGPRPRLEHREAYP